MLQRRLTIHMVPFLGGGDNEVLEQLGDGVHASTSGRQLEGTGAQAPHADYYASQGMPAPAGPDVAAFTAAGIQFKEVGRAGEGGGEGVYADQGEHCRSKSGNRCVWIYLADRGHTRGLLSSNCTHSTCCSSSFLSNSK